MAQRNSVDSAIPTTRPLQAITDKWSWYILPAFAFILYFNTLGHDYALDDFAVITENRFTQKGLAGIPEIVSSAYWAGKDEVYNVLYRPLSVVTFAIEYEIFGLNPGISHFINVCLYAITGLLLFGIPYKLAKGKNASLYFIATLLFIGHPLHTEVVANIKSRDELLSLIFLLLMIYCLIRYAFENRAIYFIAGSILYFLSLMTKESSITFLAVVPLILIYFTNRKIGEIIKISSALLPGVFLYFILRYYSLGSLIGVNTEDTLSPINNILLASENYSQSLATGIYILGKCLFLFTFPHPLVYDYSFGQVPFSSFGDPVVLIVILLIVGAGFYILPRIKKRGIFSFAVFLFFITYSVTSNLVILIGATMAERFLYIPSISYCLLLSLVLVNLANFRENDNVQALNIKQTMAQRGICLLLLLIILSAYSFKTITRNLVWKNNETLVSNDIKIAPNSPRIVHQYSDILIERAKEEENPESKKASLNEAIDILKFSIKRYPKDMYAYVNLGNAYSAMEDYENAIAAIKAALRHDPNYILAKKHLGTVYNKTGQHHLAVELYEEILQSEEASIDLLLNLGTFYINDKNYVEAIKTLKKLILLDGDSVSAHHNLAEVYTKIDSYENAVKHYEKTLTIDPYRRDTLFALGRLYFKLKRYKLALEKFEILILHKPDDYQTYFQLATLYVKLNQSSNALENYRLATQYNSNYAVAFYNLGNLHFSMKDYNAAITSYMKAIEVKPDYAKAYANLGITYNILGQLEKGKQMIQKAIELDPSLSAIL